MSGSDQSKNVAVQTTIAPVQGARAIVIGFNNEVFSQALFIPVTTVEDLEKMADMFRDGILAAGREVLRNASGLVVSKAPLPKDKRRG